MTKDEALTLALEALQAHGTAYLHHELRYEEAITAIKEALAQPKQEPTYEELDRIASELQDLCDRQALMLGAHPKQEPVAWWDAKLGVFDEKHFDQLQPLYTHPLHRPWVGLTDEEINDAYRCAAEAINFCTPSHTLIVRAAESKLKAVNGFHSTEKNT